MRSTIFATCIAASVCLSAGAAAQPPKSPATPPQGEARTDQARELYVKGVALYEQGQFEKAEAALLAAWALKKHYQIASNLGACEMKLGRYRDAAEHLAFFLREQPATSNQEDRKRTQALFDEARAKVGAVVLNVNVTGAVVSVDGREIGPAPLPGELYVDPGTRTLAATHGSYKDAQQVIEAKAGGKQTVTLMLTSMDGPVPPRPKRSVVPGAVMAAVGGAALVTGIGLFAAGRSKESSIRALHDSIVNAGHDCTPGAPTYDARCGDLTSQAATGTTLQRVGVGLMIGAGAAAVGTLIYFVVPSSAATTKAGGLRVTPALSPSAAGLAFSGSF